LEVRDKIVAWLVDEDHEVRAETPPKQLPLEWVLKVTVKVPLRVNLIIQQPTAKRDRIIVQLNVAISPQHKEKMAQLDAKARARLIHGILESLAHLCPECLVIAIPNPLDPTAFSVSRVIYEEELSRPLLANTVRTMVNAFAVIVGRFNVELGTVEPGKEKRSPSEPPSFI